MSTERAVIATVTGRVHGVGFRYSTQHAGQQRGLTGWVRNRPDGTVETWAQGPQQSISSFIAYLEQGPPAARVTSVTVSDVDPDPAIQSFRVRY